ncbi:IGK protein, partial [Erithacus rubecula]|nr:IGK protein [Erithacus rubecula]
IIHWYKQKEGEAPGRLLFFSGHKVTVERGFQADRYMVEGNSVQKRCVLTIKDVIPDDAATYYCAYWDPHLVGYYLFGSGSKLIVSEKASSPPANSEILQSKKENQTTYVCLIEKFYPEVIKVTWADDEKDVTDNVVKGDAWKSPKDDDDYSIASWLTVPAKNKDKKYYCKYEHEEKQASLSTQDSVKTASQEEGCGKVFNRGNLTLFCLIFVTDQLRHRTAYLVYIILLLKSSMYYLILLFFIYK